MPAEVIGIGDASIAPLLAAITLGMVGPEIFAATISRNEAFNHAGNAVNAGVSAVLGYTLGLGYVAVAIVDIAVASSVVVGRIEPSAIVTSKPAVDRPMISRRSGLCSGCRG